MTPRIVYVVLTGRGVPIDVYKSMRHARTIAKECRDWRVAAYVPRVKK